MRRAGCITPGRARWPALGAVLLFGAAVGACGGGGEDATDAPCPAVTPTTAEGAYLGVLFDGRVHLHGPELTQALTCVMPPLEVAHAVLIAPMDPNDTFRTELEYRDAVARAEGRYLPMLTITGAPLDRSGLDRIVREVGLFFRGVWASRLADVPDDVFDRAAETDFFVAAPVDTDALGRAVEDHPDTKLLAQARRPVEGLAALVREHANLFVTVEAPRPGDVGDWLPVIQAAPDRIMWGSGVDTAEDATPTAYAAVVADARAFIGRLPRPMQEGLAAGNARRLLGIPEPPEPDA